MAIYIFDLDGVVYRGRKVIEGAPMTLKILRERGHKIFFLTNDTSRTREGYAVFLKSMGIQCAVEEVMTSAYATAVYFKRNNIVNANVLAISGKGLEDELRKAGIRIVEKPSDRKKIDYVVAGLDKRFNFKKLVRAQQAIFSGAIFLATNNDYLSPKENIILPGAGVIVAAIRTATGRSPIIIGKPETFALELILNERQNIFDEVIIVGDTLETDIVAGNKIGATTVLVLTGITSAEEVQLATGYSKPDIICDDITKLI